jgi:hypothetical protein
MSNTRISIFGFLLEIIAAFIIWGFKGFKGKVTDEMSRPHESSKKSWRNIIISIIILLIIYVIVSEVQKRNETKKPIITIEAN